MRQGLLSLGAFFLSAIPVYAGMVGSGRQLPAGSVKVFGYYEGTQSQDLTFSLSGEGTCTTNNTVNPNSSFACGSTGKVSGEGSGGAAMVKLLVQPYESVQYWAAVGAGDYTLKVASVTRTNTLSGRSVGPVVEAGVKAILWPDTVVAPGLAAQLGFGWRSHRFQENPAGLTAVEGAIDQRLDLLSSQVALETGHLFKPEGWRVGVEPYGGVKWVRTQAWLRDHKGGGRVGGIEDTVTPFLGLQIPAYENEGLFAEATFVGGFHYAAGLSVRFK